MKIDEDSMNGKYLHRASFTLVVLAAMAGQAQAADSDEIRQAVDETPLTATWNWLEKQRDGVSRNVSTVGRNLDAWLAGEGIGERTNESYLRLKVNQRLGRIDNYEGTLRLSGRVDLPRATERWKLILESEEVDRNSLRDQRLNNIRSSSLAGGFSYELPERDGWRHSHDAGIRGSLPFDPFYRFRSRYGRQINDRWYGGIDNKFWYHHQDGWGQDARVYFSRSISDNINFRIDSEVEFRDDRNEFEFGQSFSIHHSLGDRETLTYEIGILGLSQPNPRTESYYTQAVYRKAIHEDWLIMEVAPQLIAERENDWKPDPQIQLNFEVYFFDF